MKRFVGPMLVLLLALPALTGQEKSKEEGKKPPSVKEQYDALLLDFSTQQRQIIMEAQKVKGDEQQKLYQKYLGVGKDFAEKVFKLAEDNPKDPVATEAAFWVLQNGSGSPVYKKAQDKVTALVDEIPLKDLAQRVSTMRGFNQPLMETVFNRAEKDAKDPLAGDLLAWIAVNGSVVSIGQKAAAQLIEKFPDHRTLEQICQSLSYGNAPKAVDTLKLILEKSSKPRVQAAAAIGLGRLLSGQADRLGDKMDEADKVAAEAEKYLVMVVEKLSKDNEALTKDAERELKALRTLRVGKEGPEIAGADLDEKNFKLSDYRGKVVLLDFWGNW